MVFVALKTELKTKKTTANSPDVLVNAVVVTEMVYLKIVSY